VVKIAHIITRMDRGGAPDIVRILFEKLDQEQFDLTLIYGLTVSPSQRSAEFLKSLGKRAILIPALCRAISPFYDLAAFFAILKVLRNEKFHIVHTHTAKAGILGRIAARIAGVKVIIHSPHGHDFYGYFGDLASWFIVCAERFAAPFCEKIHALTELEKKDMLLFKICPPEKIKVIYSGVEVGFLRPSQHLVDNIRAELSVKDKIHFVGMVGRLEPIKGVSYFIEAAKMVTQEMDNVEFLVVGDGSLKEDLKKMAESLGLSAHLAFMGWREDVNTILFTLDLLVLSSLNEAVGRCVLEAQAVGVPVVATRVGGVPEVVLDGVTGLLVPPKDPKKLAEAILFLLKTDDKRRQMSEAGRGWVDEKFSDRVMVEKFVELYRELMREKGTWNQ